MKAHSAFTEDELEFKMDYMDQKCQHIRRAARKKRMRK
jgi:hypothetical protein